jgi:ABC-type cobalt transport system substrate-binding protein
MRSSKGTAQFLIIAFIILVALVIISTKNADKKHPGAGKQATRAATVKPGNDDD